VKNQQMASMVRELQQIEGITGSLGYYEVIGTWRDLKTYVQNLQATTVDDLKRLARQYLKPTGANVLVIKRRKK
jgi:predicted Zn-dependent peptidase